MSLQSLQSSHFKTLHVLFLSKLVKKTNITYCNVILICIFFFFLTDDFLPLTLNDLIEEFPYLNVI